MDKPKLDLSTLPIVPADQAFPPQIVKITCEEYRILLQNIMKMRRPNSAEYLSLTNHLRTCPNRVQDEQFRDKLIEERDKEDPDEDSEN